MIGQVGISLNHCVCIEIHPPDTGLGVLFPGFQSDMRDIHEIERLYVQEHGRLEARIWRRLGNRAAASDLVHDIFLRLWEKAAEHVPLSAAYLSRCARNAAIDHLRAEHVRRNFAAGLLPEQQAVADVSPLHHLEAKDSLRQLEAIMRALPERTRHVFVLNRTHGCNYAEIAAAMAISVSAVEKHMARAILACRIGLQ